MLPLTDSHPTLRTPIITWLLIAACIAVFLLQTSAGDAAAQQAVGCAYGFIPAFTLGGAQADPSAIGNIGWPGVFSSMFMHGGWAHLGGNMLFLWIFGDNLEDRLGRFKFILFYLICGIAAALAQAITDPASTIPMVGASGAISGVLGGYWLLYPRQQITVMAPYLGLTQMPALVVLGMWFMGQLAQSFAITPGQGGVAFWAHIGGFIAGVVLIKLFAGPDVRQRVQLWEDAPKIPLRHAVKPRAQRPDLWR